MTKTKKTTKSIIRSKKKNKKVDISCESDVFLIESLEVCQFGFTGSRFFGSQCEKGGYSFILREEQS